LILWGAEALHEIRDDPPRLLFAIRCSIASTLKIKSSPFPDHTIQIRVPKSVKRTRANQRKLTEDEAVKKEFSLFPSNWNSVPVAFIGSPSAFARSCRNSLLVAVRTNAFPRSRLGAMGAQLLPRPSRDRTRRPPP
jgi:hypothetical protein